KAIDWDAAHGEGARGRCGFGPSAIAGAGTALAGASSAVHRKVDGSPVSNNGVRRTSGRRVLWPAGHGPGSLSLPPRIEVEGLSGIFPCRTAGRLPPLPAVPHVTVVALPPMRAGWGEFNSG